MNKLIVLLAAAASFAAMADGPKEGARPKMRKGPPPMQVHDDMSGLMFVCNNPRAAERLGLSEAQKQKLKDMKSGNRGEEFRALQNRASEGMRKQAELMKSENIDEASVMAAIDEVWDARKEIAKSQARRIMEIKRILTPEQVANALEIMKERRHNNLKRGPNRREDGPDACAQGGKPEDNAKNAPQNRKAPPKRAKKSAPPPAEG